MAVDLPMPELLVMGVSSLIYVSRELTRRVVDCIAESEMAPQVQSSEMAILHLDGHTVLPL